MQRVLVMGAGKIGTCIAFLLAREKDYFVYLADILKNNPHAALLNSAQNAEYVCLDAADSQAITAFVKKNKITAIISSLPFYCNTSIAKVAAEQHVHYFDLTEDVQTTQSIQKLAQGASTAFVPQCGLAPGLINIIANELMRNFQQLDSVKLRVGALPANSDNALKYALTWSTDGLINEYGNPCQAIELGKPVTLQPLEGLEEIKIDGLTYEAFNTSGGIGSLVESYAGQVNHLSYKTIRYPGHCEKIKFLMNDLKLNEDRKTLKKIFEHAIPETHQDVVLVYVSVTGKQEKHFNEETFVRKFYPAEINGEKWSAIQLTTASEICTLMDLILHHPKKYAGFIRQEQFSIVDVMNNRFGKYYSIKE